MCFCQNLQLQIVQHYTYIFSVTTKLFSINLKDRKDTSMQFIKIKIKQWWILYLLIYSTMLIEIRADLVSLCHYFLLSEKLQINVTIMMLRLYFQGGRISNRLFYLSVPPNIFVDVVRCASTRASSETGWTRVIVEKPFGRDSESSSELTRSLKQYLNEDQIFR